jgi:type I restriction enzyme S subunit
MKLGDIIVANYGKSLVERERIKGPIPVYGSSGLTGWHNTALCNSEAIIVGRKGNVGAVHYTQGPFYCIDTTYYILPSDNVNFKYLYYNLIYQKLGNLNDGSPVPGLKRDNLYDRDINLPDAAKQQRIAGILSAYDNLIDNNQKQIKLLEEAAMRLYKEWFVKLRFPGHEKSTIENSIPEDWKIVQLGEISDFKYGKMPKKDKIKDTGYPIFSGYGIVGYYDEFMFENEMLILVARGVGGTGDVKLSPCRCYLTNLSIAFLLHEEKHKYFLYQQYQYKNLRELDTGAAQSQITIENLKRHKTILPSIKIIEDFNRFFQPLHDKVLLLTEQINMLQAARDKLLPKLMSGEIEV